MTSDHFIGPLSASRDWTARLENGQPIDGFSTLSAMPQKRSRTEYGERVYKARTHARLTQPQLAKAAGMSQGTLGELEYNAQSSRFTAQIASACAVRAEWLATGEGEMIDRTSLLPEVAELAHTLQELPEQQRKYVLLQMRVTIDYLPDLFGTKKDSQPAPEPKQPASPIRARKG